MVGQKFQCSTVNSWNKKELSFPKKTKMLKLWKLNVNKEESNCNVRRIKGLYFSNSLPLFLTKSYYWNVFLPTCKNFTEKNCLDKPVFNNVSRINNPSSMNSTFTNKIKHKTQLFTLGPQTALRWKRHYFLSWSTIITKLEIYVYKYKADYIYNGLL